MTWWVLTYIGNSRSLHHLYVVTRTNHPAHLFMTWARHAPARKPRYITVRGKRIRCGWTYIWNTPNLTEQNQSGYTFYHTFGPISLASMDHVWYFLSSIRTLYERYCQSALFHVWPPELHTWTTKMYVGTKLKGIFYTDTFTGPGGQHPVWTTANSGLHSLRIAQLEPDPLGLKYRHYCLAGYAADRILYRRIPSISPAWVPVLTMTQAEAITASTEGSMRWLKTNINHPASVFLLYYGHTPDHQAFLLRSPDYGATWTASEINPWPMRAWPVNLDIGISAGLSPYSPGAVFYCIQSTGAALYETYIMRSFDYGYTWSRAARTGNENTAPLVYVDPTDQSIIYTAGTEDAIIYDLFRSTDHGATIVDISANNRSGPFIAPRRGLLWIDPTNHQFLRALQENHIWTTPDSGANWTDHGLTAQTVATHTALWENPDRLYLARHVSGAAGPPHALCHVIFTSEDEGATMYGKAGAWACEPDGHGDSIPYNCGGVCYQGMQLLPPY